jgi:putative endonuclease
VWANGVRADRGHLVTSLCRCGRDCAKGRGTAAAEGYFVMFYVYLLASKPYGTLYIGTTSDLVRRVWEHKNKVVPRFTKRYGVDRLMWFEAQTTAEAALRREKQIKEWKRDWKINLIECDNRHWIDLYPGLRP